MKKLILTMVMLFTLSLVFFNVNLNTSEKEKSVDLLLSNVQALADIEDYNSGYIKFTDDCPYTFYGIPNTGYFIVVNGVTQNAIMSDSKGKITYHISSGKITCSSYTVPGPGSRDCTSRVCPTVGIKPVG